MSTPRPDTTYIYERNGDTVFRREVGATQREVMGYDYRTTDSKLMEDKLWSDILQEADTNPTLQDALDRVIMIYRLSKTT